MKQLLVALSVLFTFTLFGCSQLDTQTKTKKVEETIIGYIDALKNGDVNTYHEFTSFQMANEYKASYIAADPFANSSFENFVILQYLIQLYKLGTYEVLEQTISENTAIVSVKLTVPNYTDTIHNYLPDIISTFKNNESVENVKSDKVSALNKEISYSLQEAENIEMINTFKLQYIEGSWYIVENGELYNDLQQLVPYANRLVSYNF
ncbi:MAG: hypothetical protein ACRCST_13095 [Turicibacter sp.]